MFNNKNNNTNITTMVIVLMLGYSLSFLPYDLTLLLMLNIYLILISLLLTYILSYQYRILKSLKILETNYDFNMRCLKLTMINNNSLSGEDLFKGIYQTLMSNKDFNNFGFHKIIILSVTLSNNREYNVHSNILIDNNTTFEDYFLFVSKDLSNYNNLEYGYHNEEILKYNVLCWNVDDKKNSKIKQTHNTLLVKGVSPRINKIGYQNIRSFTTSPVINRYWYKGLIKPISLFNKKGILKQLFVKTFFTMDLETIELNNLQIPIAISSCGFYNNNLDSFCNFLNGLAGNSFFLKITSPSKK